MRVGHGISSWVWKGGLGLADCDQDASAWIRGGEAKNNAGRPFRTACADKTLDDQSSTGSGRFAPTPTARRSSLGLVRIDEEFLAGGALGVNGDIGELERFLERDPLGVVTREGGFQSVHDALSQPLPVRRPDLHQERE